ncbi:MAG: pilin [Patescibacteria group bacterium]
MKLLNKNFFIAIFIFISIFCVGHNSLAAEGNSVLKNFQIMPKAMPCPNCECNCTTGTATEINTCLDTCIDKCKTETPAGEDGTGGKAAITCYNNICSDNTADANNIYQCSTCAIDGDCYLNDFLQVFVNIANIVLVFSGVFALLMLIYNSFQFLISMGDEKKVQSGITGIKNVIIGLVIVMVAWTLVSQAKKMMGFDEMYNLTSVDVVGDPGTRSLRELNSGSSAVGCCVPDNDLSLPPAICLPIVVGSGCPDGYTQDNELCDDITDCTTAHCEYRSVCGVGSTVSCLGQTPCTDMSGYMLDGNCVFCSDSISSGCTPSSWAPADWYH